MTNHNAETLFWSRLAELLDAGVPLSDTWVALAADEALAPLSLAEVDTPGLGTLVDTLHQLGIARPELLRAIRDAAEISDTDEAQRRVAACARALAISQDLGGGTAMALLIAALDRGVSDIHIDPTDAGALLRHRLDGLLHEERHLSPSECRRILDELEQLATLKSEERHLPRMGMMTLLSDQHGEIDVRVATGPTALGTAACLRILHREPARTAIAAPERIIPDDAVREAVLDALPKSLGLFLVTGPTGAGKTTTGYTLLQRYDAVGSKIITAEDPVELTIPNMQQIPAQPPQLSLAGALRHALHMDPDVLYCGEIRDAETAQLLLRAALTGHVVLSQLHTKDTVDAIVRLVQLGLEPWLLGDVLTGVLAQRLVRRLCGACRRQSRSDESRLERLTGLSAHSVPFEAVGCDECRGTGYRGRTPIFELMTMSPRLRAALDAGGSRTALTDATRGQKTLFDNGLDAVYSGRTSLTELLRQCTPNTTAAPAHPDPRP